MDKMKAGKAWKFLLNATGSLSYYSYMEEYTERFMN